VVLRPLLDPRRPSAKAAVIAFKTDKSDVFVYMRREGMSGEMSKLFESFYGKVIVTTDMGDLRESLSAEFGVLLRRVVPLSTIGTAIFKTGGLQNFATIAWGSRFCTEAKCIDTRWGIVIGGI
jgi:hypothetical protein